jgi:hydrogenase-4 component E
MGFAPALAELCGAGMLVIGFAMLVRARFAALVGLLRWQAILLAAGSLARAAGPFSVSLVLTFGVILVVNVVLGPLALRRMAGGDDEEAAWPAGALMAVGLGLTGAAFWAVPRAGLATALAVILLGLLLMAARRGRRDQVIGLLAAGNGLVLAAICLPGLPFVALVPLAMPAFAAASLIRPDDEAARDR